MSASSSHSLSFPALITQLRTILPPEKHSALDDVLSSGDKAAVRGPGRYPGCSAQFFGTPTTPRNLATLPAQVQRRLCEIAGKEAVQTAILHLLSQQDGQAAARAVAAGGGGLLADTAQAGGVGRPPGLDAALAASAAPGAAAAFGVTQSEDSDPALAALRAALTHASECTTPNCMQPNCARMQVKLRKLKDHSQRRARPACPWQARSFRKQPPSPTSLPFSAHLLCCAVALNPTVLFAGSGDTCRPSEAPSAPPLLPPALARLSPLPDAAATATAFPTPPRPFPRVSPCLITIKLTRPRRCVP